MLAEIKISSLDMSDNDTSETNEEDPATGSFGCFDIGPSSCPFERESKKDPQSLSIAYSTTALPPRFKDPLLIVITAMSLRHLGHYTILPSIKLIGYQHYAETCTLPGIHI